MARSAVALARLIAPPGANPPDKPLLRAFVSSDSTSSEAAFTEIVRRHGPMVLAVCRRVLGNAADADDAFQATFIVLARKAATIRGNLAGWLYAVAVRTARGVRVMRDRRRKHETSAANGRRESARESAPADHNLASIIDEELARLPEHYREALVLCELRGLSRKQAAMELDIPEGTLSSRLAAAKRKLAALLRARGLTAPAVLVPLAAPAAVPAALIRSAVAATRGTAGPIATAAAGAMMKGMLFEQVRTAVLAAGILLATACGGWALTGVPDENQPARAPAPRTAEDRAAELIAQLAAPEYADREKAAAQLRSIGMRAEPALKRGLRSDNPEIRARSEQLITGIRKAARSALLKQFDPQSDAEPDHPVWKRFKSLAGNDAAARKLFAEIIADPRRLQLLDEADQNPQRAGNLYAAEVERWYRYVQKLLNRPTTGTPSPAETPYPDPVTALYLGTYPASHGHAEAGWHQEGHLFIESWNNVLKSTVGPAVKRIFAAWLPLRNHPDTRERGLAIAASHGVKEALPFARKVLLDEKDRPEQRAQSALILGLLGTTDDRALLRRVAESKSASEPFIHFTVVLHGQADLDALWGAQRFGRKPIPDDLKRAAEKADIRTGNRSIADCAWAAAVRHAGGKPEELGFLWPRMATGGKVDDGSFANVHSHGFETQEARVAAHARAKEFLDKQPLEYARPPVKGGNVWPHFARVVGDNADSRALFDLITAHPKSRALLERAAAGDRDLLKLYRARREELNALAGKLNPATPTEIELPPQKGTLGTLVDGKPTTSTLGGVPVDEIAGWLLLGTFPGTKRNDRTASRPEFLHPWLGQQRFGEALRKGSLAKPLRKLVAAWLANRGDEPNAIINGMELALMVEMPDVLPTAKRVLEKYATGKSTREQITARGVALLIIGKYGTKTDRPLLERFANDTEVVSTVLLDKPGQKRAGTEIPVDGQDATTQVGDLALAMMVHLEGGNPRDLGFFWHADLYQLPLPNPYTFHEIGFLSKRDREISHNKAREWLAHHKK